MHRVAATDHVDTRDATRRRPELDPHGKGPMTYRLLADIALVVHLLFIAFVIGGGFLALRWPRLAWLHVPCFAWGVLIEFAGWICPLTPIENALRVAGGEAGYTGGFIEHYILPIVYPGGLTREIQIGLGVAALGINVLAYTLLLRRHRRGDRGGQ